MWRYGFVRVYGMWRCGCGVMCEGICGCELVWCGDEYCQQ